MAQAEAILQVVGALPVVVDHAHAEQVVRRLAGAQGIIGLAACAGRTVAYLPRCAEPRVSR